MCDPILTVVEKFLQASGMSASAFGAAAVNDQALVQDLRAGREPRRATRVRITDYINAALAD
jgi:hypothetical protein